MPRSCLSSRQASQRRGLLLERLETRELLATFAASNLADSGPGSLRQAIIDANNSAGSDTINITAVGALKTASALPIVSGTTIIQSAVDAQTGRPKFAIDGSQAGAVPGLVLEGSGCTVQGIAIYNFSGPAGLVVGSSNNTIVGNFLGLGLDGTTAKPNSCGIMLTPTQAYVDVTNNVVGGVTAASRNVISGNSGDGLAILGGFNNQVIGNFIGTDFGGTVKVANGGSGVVIDSFSAYVNSAVPQNAGDSNQIGGIAAGQGNRIRGNGAAGVLVYDGWYNAIRGNQIDVNGGLGIDLGGNGLSPNDKDDVDVGSNYFQNFPLVGGASITSTSITVGGVIYSTPNTLFKIDAYASPAADSSGNGEGWRYLGSTSATTTVEGGAGWSISANIAIPAGWVVSATATDPLGNTSEFSNAVPIPAVGSPATVQFLDAAPRYKENSGIAELTLTRTGDLSGVTKVTYTTGADTASVGSDFSNRTGTVRFDPGETLKTIQLPLVNDQISEGLERFNVTLSSPVNGTIAGTNPAKVAIVDDDFFDLRFSGDGLDQRGTTGPADDSGKVVVTQPDGKYVVAGSSFNKVVLARYNADGSLDATFGTQGRVTAPLPGRAQVFDMVRQSDGKLVIAGNAEALVGYGTDTILVRFNSNGTPDATFGTSGVVRTDLSSSFSTDEARALALQSDGKIVVAATTENKFVTLRYTTTGALDATFGAGGRVDVDFTGPNTYDNPTALTIQPDGMIVVAGDVEGPLAVMRLTASGALDTTFNGTGQVLLSGYSASGSTVYDVAITPANKVLLGAKIFDASSNYLLSLVQFNADGTLDTTFDGDGKAEQANTQGSLSLVVQSSGKILVGTNNNASQMLLERWNANGSLDTTFNGTGSFALGFGGSDIGTLYSIAVDSNGKLVAAGDNYLGDFAIARINLPSPSLDTTFNGTGKATTDFTGAFDDEAVDVLTQPDGKVLMMGTRTPPTGSYSGRPLILYRYNANGTLDTSFGASGQVFLANAEASDMALQADGKILVTISSAYNFASGLQVLRLNANGTIDNTFDSDGVATASSLNGTAKTVLVQSDGKIVLSGVETTYDVAQQMYVNWVSLARFNTNGSPDNTFGTGGALVTNISADSNELAVSLDGSGRLLVCGAVQDSLGNSQLVVGRLTASGNPDLTFNSTGKRVITTATTGSMDPVGVRVTSTGQIVAAASFLTGGQYRTTLVRLLAGGGLDTTFGGTGIVYSDFGGNASNISDMLVDASDRVVVIGSSTVYGQSSIVTSGAVARFLTTGAFDAEFGSQGILTFDFGGDHNAQLAAVTEDANKNLVVVGTANADMAIARLRTTADPGPFAVVQLATTAYTIVENVGSFTVTINRTGDTTIPANVNWYVGGNSATIPQDLPAQSGTIAFAAGQTSKTITININNDTLHENSEVFRLSLANATGATQIGLKQGAIVTITDDDPLPSLSVNDVSIVEGDSGTKDLVFTLLLSAASGLPVSVTYKTTNGSATSANDFIAIANTTVTFSPGQTSKTVTVKIKGDAVAEATEQFFLDLLNPSGATISKSRGTATITDNDPAAIDAYFGGL